MLRKLTLIPVLFALLATTACVKTRFELDEAVEMKDVMRIKVIQLRDKFKKGKYDVSLEVSNLNDKSLVFYYGEIRCFRDGQLGRLDYPFFGAGERAIDLKPHETKRFNYTCKTERTRKPGQAFKLVYGRIFENPNNDGLTSGRILGKDLSLEVLVEAE